MLNRDRFLQVHGVTAEEWAQRWGIEPGSAPCHFCKRRLTTTIPFALENLRGLASPPCECGNEGTPYCVVDAGGGDPFLKQAPAKPRRARAKKRRLRLVKS